ncbi:hypothetical protein HFN_2144 [Helicobacter fennelliae MRY12-0050]|uniref:Uncharacterized protein n=1 Tax=Helicobacter fennelliae MRY12-0050 TaxID=1325130 RepID=T1DVP2_9HELI|nr:hypothetical protein HFN_2144 [Helicobacter fennelliae MRY12-0050]
MQKCAPNASFKAGKKISFGASKSALRKWLAELGNVRKQKCKKRTQEENF